VTFDTGSTLHHVLESSQLLHVFSTGCSKVCFLCRFVFRNLLLAEATSSVISLILVKLLHFGFEAASFRKSPSWLLRVQGRFACLELWSVSCWSNRCWGGSLINQSTAISPLVTESILCSSNQLWLVLWEVLWPWVSLHVVWIESWFCADFWGTCP